MILRGEYIPAEVTQGVTYSVAPQQAKPLSSMLPPRIERRLGYFGKARHAMFYYEPRGDDVIWNDGVGYGFAAGGWREFFDSVAPLADTDGYNLGQSGIAATHVLLVDRLTGNAYWMERSAAIRFVAQQHSESSRGKEWLA